MSSEIVCEYSGEEGTILLCDKSPVVDLGIWAHDSSLAQATFFCGRQD